MTNVLESKVGERDCANCKHYVVTDEKHCYEQNGCGTYMKPIYGCEAWECEFEPKEKEAENAKD